MAQVAAAKQPTVTDIEAEEESSALEANAEANETREAFQNRLKAYQSPYLSTKAENILGNRYRIEMSQPLEYGYQYAKAYAAHDTELPERAMVAVVCDPHYPPRHHLIEKMKNADHPHIVTVAEAGVIRLSGLAQERFVIVYEKPQGKTLAALLREGVKLTEAQVVQQLLKPLCIALKFFDEQNIGHLCVNPENIFIGDTLTLGDACAEPAGLSQPFVYEPVERLLCSPYGKGEGNVRVDAYALGVIAAEALYGLEKHKQLGREPFAAMLVQHGAQSVILGSRTHTEYFQDFFRGMMNDQASERWNPAFLRSWLAGKRFNLLSGNAQREALRSIEFKGKEYFNRRALAHAFCEHWEEARYFVPEAKLPRWLEQSLLKPDLGSRLAELIEDFKNMSKKSERQFNDLLAKTILLLDPQGPIRLNQLALYPDGVGIYISECFRKEMHAELALVTDIVINDLGSFWSQMQSQLSAMQQDSIWRMQKMRNIITDQAVGLGMERCLYELNPQMPCRSHLTKEYYITGLQPLLQALDAMSSGKGASDNLYDRHFAAFLTARLGMFKDQKSFELKDKAALMGNPELKLIRLLAKAQERSNMKLPGLTLWVALRVLGMMEHIHSRRFRKSITADIRKCIDDARIKSVLQVFFNEKLLGDDNNGFYNAWTVYQRNKQKIQQLKNREFIKSASQVFGARLSSSVATLMLLYAIYYAVKSHMS